MRPRILISLPLLVPAAVVFMAALWPLRSQTGSGELAGKWEGSVLDARRPYLVSAEFRPSGTNGEWSGSITSAGNTDAPLTDIVLKEGKLSFKAQLRQGTPAFQAELRGDEIAGKVTFPSGLLDFKLTRLPVVAAPKDRVEAWQQDIDVAQRFTRYDRTFTAAARVEYRRRLDALRARVASLNDQQILVELAKAVALGNNAHTNWFLGRATIGRTPFPLRLQWFKDGLYVVRAAPAHAAAVGCRVTAVDGHPTSQVQNQLAPVFAGNAAWVNVRTASTFVRPELLYGLGITKELERATYSLECANGPQQMAVATDSAAPAVPANDSDWASVIPSDARPLYLRHRDKNYWFEYLAEPQILYFQFNSSLNGGDETIPQFGARLLKELEDKPVKALVADLRFNGGGNLSIGENFIETLRSHAKLQGKNKLFVITGNATFSAAIYHASQLRANPGAVFIGEPVGDHLEFWAEGDSHVLPNSRVALRSSNGYHSYSKADPPEFKPYYRDLSITSLGPDVVAQPTFKEYAAKRDLAMEAVLARVK